MKTLGLNPSEENLDKIMRECDADGSGDIDFSEFIDVMSKKVNAHYTPAQLNVAFSIFKTDDMPNGYIKTESLEKALTIWGSDRVSTDKAVELLAAVSTNFYSNMFNMSD
jgi:Ca2+-binding EF-hand superfamily protein